MAQSAAGQVTVTREMQNCLGLCEECHRVCVQTVQYCLQKGGRHAEASHIRLLLDCADVCQTSKDFLARGSDLHPQLCAACADVCERCAESCEAFEGDEQMKRCAEICRRCAESCREMAGA